MMQEGMTCGSGGCACPHHKMVPLCITLIGLLFLLQAYGTVSASFVSVAWPILLILIGLQKMFKGMCKCCGSKQ